MRIPTSIRIPDEIGQPKTVSGDEKHYVLFQEGETDLFLGLGPDPRVPLNLARGSRACYLENPEFISRMPGDWTKRVPHGFHRLEETEIHSPRKWRIWLYRPALRLFPSFWSGVLARLRMGTNEAERAPDKDLVFLASPGNGLLTLEMEHALRAEGMRVRLLKEDIPPPDMARILNDAPPAHFLSINFQSIDGLGENLGLLERAGSAVHVWCVDNPAHLLTGMKCQKWKEINLFVTDHWFISPLQSLGAQNIFHLPLAGSPELFYPKNQDVPRRDYLFVGRSRFPDKKNFFRGQELDPGLRSEAQAMLKTGQRPDFAWWLKKTRARIWPGNEIRKAGFGAEEIAREWRREVLRAAGNTRALTIIGDEDWSPLVPEAEVLPPVDYYSQLADLYARAGINLNITSMLLPCGLTQRHFDVWLAGGFLVTDTTSGLDIFPEELVREHSFTDTDSMLRIFDTLESSPRLKSDLIRAYQREIVSRHTYRHRIQKILNCDRG